MGARSHGASDGSPLAWLEVAGSWSDEPLRAREDPALAPLRALGLLEREVPRFVGCTRCWRECGVLPVRSDEAALSVSPAGARLVVFCPDGQWRGGLPLEPPGDEALYVLHRARLLDALREAHRDASPSVAPALLDATPLFTTRYAGRIAHVVFAHGISEGRVRALLGLRQQSDAPLVVVSPDAGLSPIERALAERAGVVYVSVAELIARRPASLGLPWMWPRLAPALFADPSHDAWIATGLQLTFAERPGHGHVVQVNGEPCPQFERSDVAFAQLLRLAVARRRARVLDRGGRVALAELDDDPKHRRLEDLRARLRDALPPHLRVEGAQLIRSTRDGGTWLAMLPEALRFDVSLGSYAPVSRARTTRVATLIERALADAPLETVLDAEPANDQRG